MKNQAVALVFLVLAGCGSVQKPASVFVVEPADPELRLRQDELFLKKSKSSLKKKKNFTLISH